VLNFMFQKIKRGCICMSNTQLWRSD